jgi:UDP-3-O-[3-hydroxymyristoyl] glucosamine N-acyltransferase
VVIGKCCLIVSQVGISGSCKIGDGVVLAGQVGVADNIEIGAGVIVGAQAGVTNNIKPGKQVLWSPAIEHKDAARVIVSCLRLPKFIEQFKQLCARVDKLETSKDDSNSDGH